MGAGDKGEISVPSAQFFCEPKTTIKSVKHTIVHVHTWTCTHKDGTNKKQVASQ